MNPTVEQMLTEQLRDGVGADASLVDLVHDYLDGAGYDGLCTIGCGCLMDDGLFPCGRIPLECHAGYSRPDFADELGVKVWVTETAPAGGRGGKDGMD